jgi:hypothetical protein
MALSSVLRLQHEFPLHDRFPLPVSVAQALSLAYQVHTLSLSPSVGHLPFSVDHRLSFVDLRLSSFVPPLQILLRQAKTLA